GGRGDSFTAAVAHRDKDAAVLDCMVEVRAPFDPDAATRDICAVLKNYGCRKTVADNYAGEWTVSALRRHRRQLPDANRDRLAACTPTATAAARRFSATRCRCSPAAGTA